MTIPEKPIDSAEWATTEQINPVSGQSNIVKPPAGQVEYGWFFNQKPPRQYFNWWQNTVGNWIEWLNFRSERQPVIDGGAGNVTLDASAQGIVTLSPSSPITVKLDNSFLSGQEVCLVNLGSAVITITANNDATISILQAGNTVSGAALLKCLSDSPGTPTAWCRAGYQNASTTATGLMSHEAQSIGGVKTYPSQPAFFVEKTGSAQTGISTASLAKVTYNTASLNVGNYFSTADSRFTPPAGNYILTWGVDCSSTTPDTMSSVSSYIRKNGGTPFLVKADAPYDSSETFGSAQPSGSCVVAANGTDYFEVWAGAFVGGAGTWQINAAAQQTYFTGAKIS